MELEDVLLWDQLMNDYENAEEEAGVPRLLLNRMDPFDLSDQKFVKLFRLTKHVATQLIELVSPHLRNPSRRSALSIEVKVSRYIKF